MTPDTTTYYYLSLSVLDARAVTTVNGVGVDESDGRTGVTFNSPINSLLVGTGNQIRTTVMPTMIEADDAGVDSLRPTTLDEAQVTVTVKKITDGVVAPETGEVLARQTLQDAVEARRRELQRQFNEKIQNVPPTQRPALADREKELTRVTFPIQLDLTFESRDAPSFRSVILNAPIITNQDAVKQLAMKIKRKAEKRQLDYLYDLFKPKYNIYDRAYPNRAKSNRREWFRSMMTQNILNHDPLLNFEIDDIVLSEWADGRIWEVNVNRPTGLTDQFFLTRPTPKGRAFMDIFVGEVDGELKVVR